MGADAFDDWRRRRRAGDTTATLFNLYELVASERGHDLSAEERAALSSRALHEMQAGFEVIPGSDRALDVITLVAYDPEWPARFARWRKRLEEALGGTARRIDHFGSTSVPGLPAKPVIDIMVRVDDMTKEELYVPQIEALGVQLRSRDDDHRFFRPFAGKPRDVHIHVVNLGSDWGRKDLLFAAFLRQDAAAREEYLRGKEAAAARWADDRIAYTEAKTEVIRPIASRAEAWAQKVGWTP